MTAPRHLRTYEYVTAPYHAVLEALKRDPAALFARATRAVEARAGELGATLRAGVGPLEVAVDIAVEVGRISEDVNALGERKLLVELSWTAAHAAGWFPTMNATLAAYALSSRETQLDLEGTYRPPLKALGAAIDAAFGHRIAEASALRFVREIAACLSEELAEPRHP